MASPCQGEVGQQRIEVGGHAVGVQVAHRRAGGVTLGPSQRGVRGQPQRGGEEVVIVLDRRAVHAVDQMLARGAVVERARRHAAQSQPKTGTSCALPVPVNVIVRLITHLYSGLVNRKWLCVYPSRT